MLSIILSSYKFGVYMDLKKTEISYFVIHVHGLQCAIDTKNEMHHAIAVSFWQGQQISQVYIYPHEIRKHTNLK